MSGPLPGPLGPPTDHPKFNVLLYDAMGAIVAAFCLATMSPGYWRVLAVPFVALTAWLSTLAVRVRAAPDERQREASPE